jgi:hypothetical protein
MLRAHGSPNLQAALTRIARRTKDLRVTPYRSSSSGPTIDQQGRNLQAGLLSEESPNISQQCLDTNGRARKARNGQMGPGSPSAPLLFF